MTTQAETTQTETTLTQTPPTDRTLAALEELARLFNSVQDVMSDDIVTRLGATVGEGIALLDRLTRNEGLMRLLQVLGRPENQQHLMSLADALTQMSRELATTPPARGGIGGLWRLAREPGTQEGIRALSMLGQYWGDSLRELHRRGGG